MAARRLLRELLACSLVAVFGASATAQSLGDVARDQRQKKASAEHSDAAKRMVFSNVDNPPAQASTPNGRTARTDSVGGQAALLISSPLDGTTVNPGETVIASVVSPAGVSFTHIGVLGENPLGVSDMATSLPAQFSIVIPSELGCRRYMLTAMGVTTAGESVESAPVSIDVERPDTPVSLSPQFTTLTMEAQGQTVQMTLLATFSDGRVLPVSESSYVSYESTNTAIATVDRFGTTTAVAPGTASIRITYANPNGGSVQRSVPVTLLAPQLTPLPTALVFGGESAVKMGTTATLQLTLKNTTVSDSSLRIKSITISGDYSETDDCRAGPLPLDGTCTVKVTFAPTAPGERKGAMSVVNSASGAEMIIPLDGFAR